MVWLEDSRPSRAGVGEIRPHKPLAVFVYITIRVLLEGGSMADEKMDFTAEFTNQVKAQISALQAVLASVEQASAVGALRPIEGLDLPSHALAGGRSDGFGVPTDLPQGAFIGKSVPACIELYLSAVKKKKTNKEIVDALREGGVESNSKLDNTVNGALFKLKNDGIVLRFKDGWGLSSWYPAHIRAVTPTTSPKKTKKKGKKKEPKNASSKPIIEANSSTPPKRKAGDLIVDVLRTKPDHEYGLEAIAELAGLGVKFTRLTLGKLLKAGRVRMSAPGTYVIGKPQLVAVGD